jgi:hypothetical protein
MGCTCLDNEAVNLEIIFSDEIYTVRMRLFFPELRCRTSGAKMIDDGCGYKGEAPLGLRYKGNTQS